MSSTALYQENAPLFQHAKSRASTKSNELLILALKKNLSYFFPSFEKFVLVFPPSFTFGSG